MQIETEIDEQANRVLVRAFWGFAMLQKSFATLAQAQANRQAVADELESRIRAAQANFNPCSG